MERLICRACLKINLNGSKCVRITNKTAASQIPVKDMLEIFMPEMDLDIFEGEVVMCLDCSEALHRAYIFKNICLKTEERIYDYLHRYKIKLGKKISLSSIVEHKFVNDESGAAFEPETVEIESDSNQSGSGIFNTNCSQSESENEDKKDAKTTRKTRKRKYTGCGRKNKKTYDYNSMKRSYTCDQCEYKAYRLDLLNTHKLKHDKNVLSVKEYKCELCLYSTLRKRALDRHLFTHRGKSQHSCEVCHKTFAEKYQLKLHAITHTGQELPHKCGECGKGYLTKSYLKQHMETKHLAKMKQVCEECPSDNCEHSFTRFYKCSTCESSFSDKRGLDAHRFTHTGGELPYKCLHCDFSTAWKGNLKKHLQKKH